MALLEWTDEFVLGEARMDDTHREFVACLNALGAADDAGMIDALDRFIAHTDAHFADENERMSATAFPPAHCHLNEHDNVLKICREVRDMVSGGKIEVARVLARELAPWFKNHAATMDNMLAYWLALDEPGRVAALEQGAARQAAIAAQLAAQGETAQAGASCGVGCEHDAADAHGSHHAHATGTPERAAS